MNQFARNLLIAAGLGMAAACTTVRTTAPGAVGVTREQTMLVSEAEVERGSAELYRQELEKARSAGKLNSDPRLTARVRGIASRLIPPTAVFRRDAPGWKWEINTLETDDLNAYCLPGGKIMVYSGLVNKLGLSDAEIAAVVGHEMAHALREHSRERVSHAYAQQLALAGIGVATGAGPELLQLADMIGTVTFQLPHSREQESEADEIGLELMARGGYPPDAAVGVWRKMMEQEREGGGTPEFLSTHPSPQTRIADIQALLPKVRPLYRGR
jgi:predicted Zn-dependent protease